ncbi:type II toxin-antitoxin system HipA family toxin [Xylophilus sp. GOD-11R]|uniref:type II toxin-antitoxin system HipA family toxin n=1 Tax=Xylophilus sp. GOD-11R TaxID=3089814 RepID=UPI00298CDB46|nr:type II toxin-antitoxin system HipA family toxin [Xylophilus sp. GOD-11R]WPB59486.1 type II toxin-antitoxin system HipA family toxin [Xylophilus sp. GOD-11R]
MNGVFVGTWSLSQPSGETLQYDTAWVASAEARPLSRSLPIMPGNPPHRGAVVHDYFDNLLPDSKDIRDRVARRWRAAGTDAFDLLAEIGRDCIGALQILPEGAVPAGMDTVSASPLTESEVARLLRATLAPTPLGLADAEDFRISLAGAQEKTALLQQDGRWWLPHGTTPTTHILKLPMGLIGGQQYDMRDSVQNEWLCSRILAAYGMPVAPCRVCRFEDLTVLAVERFDRAWWTTSTGERRLIRLPQEDLCQATGTPPWMKYEADGGPGIEAIMGLLAGAIDPTAARRVFFQAQVLFWLLCATDGHAKNFSIFLRRGDAYAPTPLYDVLSAYPLLGEAPGRLSPHKASMAMAVRSKNAHWKMREILRRHWLALGERHGVTLPGGGEPAEVLDDLVSRTPGVIDTVRAEIPETFPAGLADAILKGLEQAAVRLAG